MKKSIREFCDEWNIKITNRQLDKRTDGFAEDKWSKTAFHWQCTLHYQPKSGGSAKAFETEYSMGRGHSTVKYNWAGDKVYTPIPPTAVAVLSALISDASDFANVDMMPTFEEWAENFGYNPDSIKAARTYDKCLETAIRLARFLPGGLKNFVENVENDY